MTTCYAKAETLTFKASGKGASANETYIVLGTSNEMEAVGAANSTATPIVTFGYQDSVVVLVRSSATAKPTSYDTWEVDIEWSEESSSKSKQRSEGQPLENMVKWSFDTTGSTQRITIAKEEVARGERSQSYPAPEMYGAMNWDGQQLQGADIVIPALKISATAPYKPSVITKEWIANLARNTGKTNSKKWQGFEAGELLYIGSTGTKDVPLANGVPQQKPFEIVHSFEASENQKPFTTGGITIENGKKGFEYAWVRFEQVDDPNTIVYPKAVHAYIDRVYDEFDFKELFGF